MKILLLRKFAGTVKSMLPNMEMTLGALFKHSASANGNLIVRC